MALKLGKCRLCLKLGDFYSIFTVDNAVQLADMVMECTRIKVYEGDGLPDKVCSECIQKLSSAYIFKQQCERADEELRRNYVPPPGFSVSPPPPNRQSSDSAFSTQTESSNLNKSSSNNKCTPPSRKRSIESDVSAGSRRSEYRPSSSKRVEELRRSQKKPRVSEYRPQPDSDYEDNGASSIVGETDSDEPLLKNDFKCKTCPKAFNNVRSLAAHSKVHSRKDNTFITIAKAPAEDAKDADEKLKCEKCEKTFKLKIMLNRHAEACGKSPPKPLEKELLVSLEPIDGKRRKIVCQICTANFKTMDNLEKHLRVVHAAALKREHARIENGRPAVPCLFCRDSFDDYSAYAAHFLSCAMRDDTTVLACPVCQMVTQKKSGFFLHMKTKHFEVRGTPVKPEPAPAPELAGPKDEGFQCRMCSKTLPTQDTLITHLAAHLSNIENSPGGADADAADDDVRCESPGAASLHSAASNSFPGGGPLRCGVCDKQFKYRKSLASHEAKHAEAGEVKVEPPEPPPDAPSDSDSSQEEDDNTCDICEKQFSYRRLLLHHKRTKHNMSSGTKRAKINLKDCSVRCLICDEEMKVSAINEHNQKHIAKNMKPRNIYTCAECGDNFKSCSGLASHIKLIHRLKQPRQGKQMGAVDLADFCEVVVTKPEPLDPIWAQSHNGFGDEVPENKPVVNLSGFSCPTCGKKMPTLVSLKRHINWHSNVGNNIEKKIECFVCKETFRFQCHYKLHMRAHYTDPALDPVHLTCALCNRRSKHLRAALAHMNFHKQTRFQTKDYQCSICRRVFQYRRVYLSHMAVHYKRGETVANTVVGSQRALAQPPGAHACPLCGHVCDSESSLKCHVSWHKSKTSLYGARHQCHLCPLQFTNKRRLELHVREHFEDDAGPFRCEVCGKGYTDEAYLRRHVKGHNFDHQSHQKRIAKLRKDKVKCPICPRYYPDMAHLIRHLRRTHPESKMVKEDPDEPERPRFPCKLCAKVFLDERRLRSHEDAHRRKPEFYQCKFCGIKTISLKNHRVHIKRHLVRKHTDEPLRCPRCEARFVRGYDLHYHLRDEHGVTETWIAAPGERAAAGPLRPLQCAVCLKVLASQGNFERHLDYHSSLRCNYCHEHFGSARFLDGHLEFGCAKRRLLGDTEVYPKRIKCRVCYKAFHVQVKLDCHLRTRHGIAVSREAGAGSSETVCDYCFKVFENEDALASHKVYHRTIGYLGCRYCPRKFNTITMYKKHKNHHLSQLNVDNPTRCDHCDETFVAFREMIYHMRDAHGDDREWTVLPESDKEETCPICRKTFFNLHRHLDYHEENKCRKCGEYFFSRADFDGHLCHIESDGEPAAGAEPAAEYLECEFCFKPVTRKSTKRLHDSIHRTSGAISCRFCRSKFKTMDAFNVHSFSHRSRKYTKKPIKCRLCAERFVRYGPFVKHMRSAHKSTKKMHYRAVVRAEPCVVCGGLFPNLHNHYRAHLLNRCAACGKYFSSARLTAAHRCELPDADPAKVFVCDLDLAALIAAYVPKDERDDEKFYDYTDDEDDEPAPAAAEGSRQGPPAAADDDAQEEKFIPDDVDEESQQSQDEKYLHMMAQSPIISDVLSLYRRKEAATPSDDVEVVDLSDDDIDVQEATPIVVVVIDDDD